MHPHTEQARRPGSIIPVPRGQRIEEIATGIAARPMTLVEQDLDTLQTTLRELHEDTLRLDHRLENVCSPHLPQPADGDKDESHPVSLIRVLRNATAQAMHTRAVVASIHDRLAL